MCYFLRMKKITGDNKNPSICKLKYELSQCHCLINLSLSPLENCLSLNIVNFFYGHWSIYNLKVNKVVFIDFFCFLIDSTVWKVLIENWDSEV